MVAIKKPLNVCQQCGWMFAGHKRSFCNKACYSRYRSEEARRKREAKACGYCGEMFVGSYDHTVYCSDLCASRANAIKRMAANPRKKYTCKQCGKEYTPKAIDRVTFCGWECSHEFRRRQLRNKRDKRDAINAWLSQVVVKYIKPCVVCDNDMVANNDGHVICSVACGYVRANTARRDKYITKTVYVTKDCVWCGNEYQGTSRTKYCSVRCRAAVESARERRRKDLLRTLKKTGDRFTTLEIFKRDKWICGLCGRTTKRGAVTQTGGTHPRSPSLDHIVPISKGGTHTRANVQCTCFLCNSTKTDRMPGSYDEMVHSTPPTGGT